MNPTVSPKENKKRGLIVNFQLSVVNSITIFAKEK